MSGAHCAGRQNRAFRRRPDQACRPRSARRGRDVHEARRQTEERIRDLEAERTRLTHELRSDEAEIRRLSTSGTVSDDGLRKLAELQKRLALAAIRMLFDFLVTGQVIPVNPAASARGPKHVVKKGKTPVPSRAEARQLLRSIDTRRVAELRDRALIAIMIYSFARVGAVVAMKTENYFQQARRMWFRLHEKGGKLHDVPAHHKAEEYVDAYVNGTGIVGLKGTPLFRTMDSRGNRTDRPMQRREVLAMVKRRAKRAGLCDTTCCHTFRATGITCYLDAGGTIEHAQRIACHESPRTTKLYDRTGDEVSLDEVERMRI